MTVSVLRMSSGLAASALVLVGCAGSPAVTADPATEQLTVAVQRTLPHDTTAFTQGLEISDGALFESTGRVGTSYVRVTDLATGEELGRADLVDSFFGEGITVAGDTVWQITWQDGVAIARDADTLDEQRRVDYDGEGWGLCTDGDGDLVMSDGSSTLTFRDPVSFDTIEAVDVTLDGQPLDYLNELDCAEDGSVYANIWKTDDIARIDPETGRVTAMIDASPLGESLTAEERAGADVLNGIAQIPGTDRFLLTGKLWPTMYEVEFTTPE